jgi:hypothetical protein
MNNARVFWCLMAVVWVLIAFWKPEPGYSYTPRDYIFLVIACLFFVLGMSAKE